MFSDNIKVDKTRRSARLTQLSRGMSLVILCVGIIVMVGWLLNIPILTQFHPSFAAMKFNTALLFVLSGTAIFTFRPNRRYIQIIVWVILLVAGLTLSQYVFGWNSGIDQLLVTDTQSSTYPGRMSGISAINFIFASYSLLLMPRRPRLSQFCAFIVAFFALIALAGYVYHAPQLYQLFQFAILSFHTAIIYLLLATALLLANTNSQFMQIMVSDSAGARLIRQVLPITILLLIVVNALFILGERWGLYPGDLILPLSVVSSIGAVVIVIYSLADRWHETDLRRIVAEDQIQQSYGQLEQLVKERTRNLIEANAALEESQMRFAGVLDTAHDAIISIDEHEHIIMFNDGAEAIFGYSTSEIIGKPVSILIPERFHDVHSQHIATFAKSITHSRVMASDRPELMGVHKNGQEIFIEASVSRLKLEGEQIFTVVIRDISRQKAAEKQTLIYKSAVESSNELITVVDRNYRYLVVNDTYLLYHQQERETIHERQVRDVVGADLFDNILKPMYERCFAGEPVSFEATNDYPLLGTRHMLVNLSPLQDNANQVVGAVVVIHDITERKQIENEIRLYQSAVEATSEVIIVVDKDYRYLLVNGAFSHYYQYERQAAIGQHMSSIVGEAFFHEVIKPMLDRCFAGESLNFEAVRDYPLLGTRHVLLSYSPLRDRDNQIFAAVGIVRDITERKSVEIALDEGEQKWRTLFEVLPVGVTLLNKEQQIVEINPALERILDVTLPDLLAGKHTNRRYIHADGSPMQPTEFPSYRATDEHQAIYGVEVGIVKEDNKTVWTSVNAAPLAVGDLSTVVVTQDITQRKQIEQALEASMEYLSMLTHALADGIMTVNLTTRTIVFVNQRFCDIFGYTQEELIGQSTRIFYDSDEPHTAFGNALQEAIKSGNLPLITERELRRKNGERFWTSTATSTLTFNGQVTEAISIVRDITERKRAELQARQLEYEREKVKILHDFITNASHDLKTPITQIITSLYLLKRTLTNDDQQNRIQRLEAHTAHLRTIVEALVQMSELDAQETFTFGQVNVKVILDDLMVAYTPLAERKKQQLTIRCLIDRIMVKGDAQYLHLALHRIIENAITFTPEGGSISISAYQEAADYVIEIKDTGIGIDAADLPHIFERFYRADKARAIGEGHTGMGLAIAHKIIGEHHGRIEVTSQPNEGSTFRIMLPADNGTTE